jgi:sirohydrochlorin ferrochelatase
MPEPTLVAVAHGSADPRASATIADLMATVAERASSRGLSVPDLRTAYLGHAPPSLAQVMQAVEGRVIVLPLLLTAAYHSKADIPRALARCGHHEVSYGATLGPHPLLLRVLERRLAEAAGQDTDRGRTGVVLAAAGSSDPEANATIVRLAAQWQAACGATGARRWFAVRPGFASAAAPSPAAAVAGLLRAGASRVLVASYLLAPGFFADRTRASSLDAGAAAVSAPLGAATEVADVLLDRYQAVGSRRRTAA